MGRDEEHVAATRAALARFAADGSDLARPMRIDFFVVAPSEAIARVVQVRTLPMGFTTSVDEDEEGTWTCTCSIVLVPELERVVALETLLGRLAEELGAVADGFGSYGNAGP